MVPVTLLLPHNLREGRRSGRRGGERCPWGHQIRGGRQIRGVPRPCATPPPYATTPTRGPPSVPSQRRSPNPSLQTGIDPLPPRRVRWRYTAGGATERTVWCRCKCRADRRIVGGDRAASATRGLPLRAAALCRLPPPSVPSHPLLCDGLEAGVPTCGGSQALQRGKLPKLRGQAAAQVVVVVKEPVRGAPEREIMGERRRVQRASATRVLPLPATIPSAPPHPLSCRHGLEAGVQSCGGSHGLHRGELPDLRGYAAGQVVADQVPARGAPEREIMGERRRTQRVASATRAAAPTRRHPPYLSTLYPVPRLGGGGGGEGRRLTLPKVG